MKKMSSCQLLNFFLVLISIHLFSSTTAQYFPYTSCNNTAGNFTDNSSYRSDLNSIFSSISSSNNIKYGFFNASSTNQSSEESPNAVGLCRGDLLTTACQACLGACASNLTQLCPNQKQALLYLENCTLRYSNEPLLGQVVTDPSYAVWNPNNATNPDSFNQALLDLLGNLRTEAASGGLLRKFASGNTVSNNSYPIYAFMQCTPDLSEQQCSDCLVANIGALTEGSLGKLGAKVKLPSCISQFETSPFLDTVEALPPSPPSWVVPPSSDKKGGTTKTVILIAVLVTVVVVLLIGIIAFIKIKKKRKRKLLSNADPNDEISEEHLQYDLTTIKLATDDFSDDKKLGQGGFGAVYMGKLSNGQEIAVKRLSVNSGQGDLEFKNEVMLLAKLQHRNLVRLLGYCLEGAERLLIYELVVNSSLDHFIFDHINCQQLDWEMRYKIIIGIARGLLYLHEDSRLRIVHRDLKASNILLDANMNPKISDFGMAKLFAIDQTQADTSRIVGTYGYMAPEYAMHGNFSVKSDVFSFGVLLLEIVCGQRNNSFPQGENIGNLLTYVWKNWREGLLERIIDPTLRSGSIAEITRCIHVGLLCVQENVANRPAMASVLLMLNSNSTTLALPSEPAFFLESNIGSDVTSTQEHNSEGSKGASKNNASFTELYPR